MRALHDVPARRTALPAPCLRELQQPLVLSDATGAPGVGLFLAAPARFCATVTAQDGGWDGCGGVQKSGACEIVAVDPVAGPELPGLELVQCDQGRAEVVADSVKVDGRLTAFRGK